MHQKFMQALETGNIETFQLVIDSWNEKTDGSIVPHLEQALIHAAENKQDELANYLLNYLLVTDNFNPANCVKIAIELNYYEAEIQSRAISPRITEDSMAPYYLNYLNFISWDAAEDILENAKPYKAQIVDALIAQPDDEILENAIKHNQNGLARFILTCEVQTTFTWKSFKNIDNSVDKIQAEIEKRSGLAENKQDELANYLLNYLLVTDNFNPANCVKIAIELNYYEAEMTFG
ncbi:MAG: hypothetical protein ABSF18_05710 [Gammaproteobacteria bacterium]